MSGEREFRFQSATANLQRRPPPTNPNVPILTKEHRDRVIYEIAPQLGFPEPGLLVDRNTPAPNLSTRGQDPSANPGREAVMRSAAARGQQQPQMRTEPMPMPMPDEGQPVSTRQALPSLPLGRNRPPAPVRHKNFESLVLEMPFVAKFGPEIAQAADQALDDVNRSALAALASAAQQVELLSSTFANNLHDTAAIIEINHAIQVATGVFEAISTEWLARGGDAECLL